MKSNHYYVYAYLDPRKPGPFTYGEYEFSYEPFYIGKGKGRRWLDHLRETPERTINAFKANKIKNIRQERLEPIVVKVSVELTDEEACLTEISLIDLVGRKNINGGPLTNLTNGGDTTAGMIYSEESKALMSSQRKGKKQTPAQYAANCSRAPHTAEHRRKISESQKGIRRMTLDQYAEMGRRLIGSKRSEESKALMSAQRKGKCSEAQRLANKHRMPSISYADFKKLLLSHQITKHSEWLVFRKNRPAGVPENPVRIYTQRGNWISWDDVFKP